MQVNMLKRYARNMYKSTIIKTGQPRENDSLYSIEVAFTDSVLK